MRLRRRKMSGSNRHRIVARYSDPYSGSSARTAAAGAAATSENSSHYPRYPPHAKRSSGLRSARESGQTQFVLTLTSLCPTPLHTTHAYPLPPFYYITVFDSRQEETRHKAPLDEAFDTDEKLRWEKHNAYFYERWWPFLCRTLTNAISSRISFHRAPRTTPGRLDERQGDGDGGVEHQNRA